MIDRLKQIDSETRMQASFEMQAAELLANEEEFRKSEGVVKVGLEVEYSIITSDMLQVDEQVRNSIVEENSEFLDAELGAAQIELRTVPIEVNGEEGFLNLHKDLLARHSRLLDSSENSGNMLLSSGTNPFVEIHEIVRTDKQKYRDVPNFHNNRRNGVITNIGDEGVDIGDAAVVGILNSVQANIEASSFDDAIDKLNRSFAISPMAVALSANAKFIGMKDTSFADSRMTAWEKSHDTRSSDDVQSGKLTRVGLPDEHYLNMSDYLNKIGKNPFILDIPEAALQVAVGLNWRDARIKFIGNSAIVEFRPVSTQPTPEENAAVMAFYVGRLLWSQQSDENLLPLNLVKENKVQAEKFGTKARLWTRDVDGSVELLSAEESLKLEISRAFSGLKQAGVGNKVWNDVAEKLLLNNLEDGSPAEKLEKFVKESELERKEAIAKGLKKMRAFK